MCKICKKNVYSIQKVPANEVIDCIWNSKGAFEKSTKTENNFEIISDDHCYKCYQMEGEMIICDSCERKCCHLMCLKPPLREKKIKKVKKFYCDYCIVYKDL